MFFKRRGGAELISIIILLVFLGAAAIGIPLVMLMIFVAIIKSSKGEKIVERKGYIGEKIVERELKKLPEDYKILNNILIKNNDRSSQIDHIVVSKFGVFVIETKMYKGWIYGKEKQRRWIQNLYGKKYYFQNPLHQNYGHIQNLKEIKGLEDVEFISLILFSERATVNYPPLKL